jgi:hypothetical protein
LRRGWADALQYVLYHGAGKKARAHKPENKLAMPVLRAMIHRKKQDFSKNHFFKNLQKPIDFLSNR